MKISRLIALTLFATVSLSSTAAYAWSLVKDDGSTKIIRCEDSSNSIVAQAEDKTWTVTSAGTKGRADGRFAIFGQAAVSGCGE